MWVVANLLPHYQEVTFGVKESGRGRGREGEGERGGGGGEGERGKGRGRERGREGEREGEGERERERERGRGRGRGDVEMGLTNTNHTDDLEGVLIDHLSVTMMSHDFTLLHSTYYYPACLLIHELCVLPSLS